MIQQLTGLGTFTRAATPQVPHPMAIALDLGLRTSSPQVARPWACRVSVSLVRPGVDGLAKDVADVERLGTLGSDMLGRLGHAAVWAAVITAAGTRTWLLYANSPDAATATAAARAAARLAFCEQADYVPTVVVEADPGWTRYLSLYPTDAEVRDILRRRAEADAVAKSRVATATGLARLRAGGVDVTRPASLDYRLTFPTDVSRSLFLQRVAAFGLPSDPTDIAGEGFAIRLRRATLPDVTSVGKLEHYLIREASKSGGRYDGWVPAAEAGAAAA